MFKKRIFLAILLVLLFTISAVSATDNITSDIVSSEKIDEVASPNDDLAVENDVEILASENSDVGTFNELESIIKNADKGSTINLDKDYKSSKNYADGISINKAMTINGNGHILDADFCGRIFKITANNVVINNIKFINGLTKGESGSAIYWTGKEGTLQNSEFINNNATSTVTSDRFKGTVCIAGDKTKVKNCIFTETVEGLYIKSNNNEISSCEFYKNGYTFTDTDPDWDYDDPAPEYPGTYGSQAPLTISGDYNTINNCTFRDNYGSITGGILFYDDSIYHIVKNSNNKISNCLFVNNTAKNRDSKNSVAGAISSALDIVIENSMFINNFGYNNIQVYSIEKITENNNWWGNTLENKNTDLRETYISAKTKELGDYCYLDVIPESSEIPYFTPMGINLELKSVTTGKCLNSNPGVEVNLYSESAEVSPKTLKLCGVATFKYVALKNAEGLVNINCSGICTNITIKHVENQYSFKTLDSLIKWSENNEVNLISDFVYNEELDADYKYSGIKLDNITINGNGHTIDALKIAPIFNVQGTVTLNNIKFKNANEAIYSSGGKITINKCLFSDCKNSAIEIINGQCEISDSDFKNNKITFGNGAAILASDSTLNIKDSLFSNNKATHGSAIYLRSTNSTIKNTVFLDNAAEQKGGAVYHGSGNLKIDNCMFDKNTANKGGGIFHYEGKMNVIDTDFYNNKAVEAGAIYRCNLPVTVKNSRFVNNTPKDFEIRTESFKDLQNLINKAEGKIILDKNYKFNPETDGNLAYGIVINKPLTIDGDGYTIDGSNAARLFNIKSSDVNIENLNLINGKNDKGGAIYWNGANGNLKDCYLEGNIAKAGGGVYVAAKKLTIDACYFYRNYASYRGAGVYVANNETNIINNRFEENQGGGGGNVAVFWVYRNFLNLYKNNTFINNSQIDKGGNAEDNHNHNYYLPTHYNGGYAETYRSIDKITVNNHEIPIQNNKLTLDVLNQIFNKDFRNGHLLVYIDGILVFNATTTNDLLQIIFDLLDLLAGNHEIKVVFTDNNGNTNTYIENITI